MRQRVLSFGFLVTALIALHLIGAGSRVESVFAPAMARAQDEPGVDAAPAADPAVAAPASQPAGDPAPARKSALTWFFEALGWPYTITFLMLSFILVALFIMNLLSARRENICPAALVEAFETLLNERKYQDAYELAKADESFLGQMLSAGMAKISSGYEKAIEAMSLIGEEESMKLEHRLSYMALIGTISPMVGLFGTVDGMIRSFSVIASSNTTPKPSELASGISTALVTTIVGLAIAIPAMAAFNILKNRVARLVFEVSVISEGLMSRFEGVGSTSAK